FAAGSAGGLMSGPSAARVGARQDSPASVASANASPDGVMARAAAAAMAYMGWREVDVTSRIMVSSPHFATNRAAKSVETHGAPVRPSSNRCQRPARKGCPDRKSLALENRFADATIILAGSCCRHPNVG